MGWWEGTAGVLLMQATYEKITSILSINNCNVLKFIVFVETSRLLEIF